MEDVMKGYGKKMGGKIKNGSPAKKFYHGKKGK